MRKTCLIIALVALPSAAGAEPSTWESSAHVYAETRVLGYRPARVLERSGGAFVAADAHSAHTFFGAELRVAGSALELRAHPYTVMPREEAKVSMAGLEAHVQARMLAPLLVGFYHHSAHNFSYGRHGYGINLNGFTLALSPIDTLLPPDGRGDRYRLRWEVGAHGYLPGSQGNAPAYAVGPDAAVAPNAAGTSTWRGHAGLAIAGERRRIETSLVVLAEHASPSSARLDVYYGEALALPFLGTFGENFLVGPHVSVARNFSRTDEYDLFQTWVGFKCLLNFGLSDRP